MHIQSMLSSHPAHAGALAESLELCIEACIDCAESCRICADACLGEPMVADATSPRGSAAGARARVTTG
jgi:hypothetical protein